ncbi:MAG: glutamine synthetase beta-grasp domain-containing protein [Proteobacteria bacterium]|nr:glutamine synthetase beta-grasp domain-containing protein [Pseudomonadota bacterium]
MRKLAKLEYIWVDGDDEKSIRSKIRYVPLEFGDEENPLPFDAIMTQIPQWTFDGSSTSQSETSTSDLILKPVRFFGNPLSNRQQNSVSYIVLCEVFNGDDTPHESNSRAKLRETVDKLDESNDFWFGLEQEYVFMNASNGLVDGWPENGEPEPQGNYYCGNGANNISNDQRQTVDTHAQFCIQSGINLGGTNAEVMKSQWEYQIGPASAISAADQLWVSRYILNRLAEVRGMYVSYDPKPVDGDWNGSGCHINVSTKKTREEGGKENIVQLCELLEESHSKHIEIYGKGNELRLTGKHETASIDEFSWSDCDRGVSVRIPLTTVNNDYKGHIEDRRPSANVDPYEAFSVMIETLSVSELELVV